MVFSSGCVHQLERGRVHGPGASCLTAICMSLRAFKKQANGLQAEDSCVQSGEWFPQTLDLPHKVAPITVHQ